MRETPIRRSIVIVISILFLSSYNSCFFSVNGNRLEEKQISNYYVEQQALSSKRIILDSYISLVMKLVHFPSLSVCIINGDKVTWSKGYGFYDLENLKLAKDNTIYLTGSISKTITGTALMQVWEQGYFDLDEDVNNYLPFSLRNPNFPDTPITFRMLLSHTSSLNQNYPDRNEYYWFNFSDDPPFDFSPESFLMEFLLPTGKYYYEGVWSKTYEPGEHAMYANIGFDLISYLVELISHQSFIEYCTEHIFLPLGMKNTSFNLSQLPLERVAIPYHYHNGEYLQINELTYRLGNLTPPDKYWRMRSYPAGGLYSTVSDLSRFLIAHMNNGCFQGERILKQSTMQLMHEIQEGNEIQYGLAWQTTWYKPFYITYSGHKGGYLGARAYMYYIPNEDIGIIYLANGDFYSQNENFRILAQDYLLTALSMNAGLIIIKYFLSN
jgi:CubicO group peptidase (beta-lactamase class C family)